MAWQALAGERIDQDEAQRLVEEGRILPLESLLSRYAERLQGDLLDLDLKRESGDLIYEIEVLGKDGRVRELELDATSGKLLKESLED